MTNPLAQDLGGVVRLLEEMTPGDLIVYDANEGDGWPPRPLWCFKNEAYDSGEEPALQGGIHYGGKEDADAIAAAVNFLRTHSAEIAGALRDAERYRWLRMMAKEELLNPKAAGSEWPDIRTYWRIPTLICSGPVGGFIDFDAAIDSAMQQGGGGGE